MFGHDENAQEFMGLNTKHLSWQAIIPYIAMIWILLLCAAIVFLGQKKKEEWELFKEEHDCKVVGKMDGEFDSGIGMTVNADGNIEPTLVMESSPNKTGWLCDDGITYWK